MSSFDTGVSRIDVVSCCRTSFIECAQTDLELNQTNRRCHLARLFLDLR